MLGNASVISVLVEYKCNDKIIANSGCLINNRYVLITSNIFIEPLNVSGKTKRLLSLQPGLLDALELFNELPEVTVIVKNKNGTNCQYKQGILKFVYVSELIKKLITRYFYDCTIDVDSKENQLKEALSVFFIIEIPNDNQPSDEIHKVLYNLCLTPHQFSIGDQICIESTPFGSRHFLTSHSRGIISNILGEWNCFILTDAPTTPGSEGSPIYKLTNKSCIGIVLSSLSWYKGEWIGLTLGVSFQALFNKFATKTSIQPSSNFIFELLSHCVVQTTSGVLWGSSVLVDKVQGIFITNSHVVEEGDPILHWNDREIKAKIIFKSENQSLDLAILKAERTDLIKTMIPARMSAQMPEVGDCVYAAGFPLFPQPTKPKPTITGGHISQVSKAMLKTSCSVLPGASGGGIFKEDGSYVGLIVCNARTEENSTTYPRINMAIPISIIYDVMMEFLKSKDITILQKLSNVSDMNMIKEWNFLTAKL